MILVGVDAGGTSTTAIAYTCEGKFIGKAEAGPGNYHNVGIQKAVENIKEAIYSATNNVRPDIACIGLAGLDSRYDYDILSKALKDLAKTTLIEHDSFISLYAETRGGPGVIVISGTGSVVMGYDGKRRIRVSGAGWLLSDEGSAYWVGRKALRLLVKMLDGREKRTLLADLILEKIKGKDLDDLIRWAYIENHGIEEIASIAEVVDIAASKGDIYAQNILREAARQLSEDAIFVSNKIGIDKVYVSGGMFNSKLYSEAFESFLREKGIVMLRKKRSPEFGALLIAFDYANCTNVPEEQPLRS